MITSTKPALDTPTLKKSGNKGSSQNTSANSTATFISLALTMSWQLAIVVLVPVVGGALLDKSTNTNTWVYVGLGVALIGSIAVMWRSVQVANTMPVPKLTAAEKKAVQDSYAKDDK